MLKPTTVRVSDDFLKELNRFTRDMKLDKSSYLRAILKKGFEDDKKERLLSDYRDGARSAEEVCKQLDITAWDFFDLLRRNNMAMNVTLEDWLDSGRLAK
jgi:hypothetical protein